MELVAVVAAVVDKVACVEGRNTFAIGALELLCVAGFRGRTAAQRRPRRRGQRWRRQDTRAYKDGNESHLVRSGGPRVYSVATGAVQNYPDT